APRGVNGSKSNWTVRLARSQGPGFVDGFMEKKGKTIEVTIVLAFVLAMMGCTPASRQSEVVAEGVLFSVEYRLEEGRTGGFTRLNDSRSVPGHNGSWNVDAYGRLTRDYLIISRPQ